MRKDSQLSLQVDTLVQIMDRAHGLDVSAYEETFLQQTLARRLKETDCASLEAYGAGLASSRAEAEALCAALRIGYSEFFRHPLTFALLEQQVLPALIAAKKLACGRELRVWSAGCAAGQEAWSVAILLDELDRAGAAPLAYRIFATDVSEPELDQARAGVYSAAGVGNVRLRHLAAGFVRKGAAYALADRIRDRVDFSIYDLLDERSGSPPVSLYGDFDLILCCNVLFYYRPDMRRRILDKVRHALAPGGYFVTGETEREIVDKQKGLRAVTPPAAVFQKR